MSVDATTVLIRRYVQFCVVGSTGVLVDMAIMFLLAHPSMLAWDLTLSKVIAAETAILNNFVWNDRWTFHQSGFGAEPWKNYLQRLTQFNLICFGGLIISVVLLNLQVRVLHIGLIPANLLAIVSASLWNYLLSYKVAWSRKAIVSEAGVFK